MMKRKRMADINFQAEIQEVLVCKYCTYETENIDDLDNHILTHEGSCEDLEEECDDIIVLVEDGLPNRKKIKSVPEAYYCPYCKYSTKRKHDLPKHLLTHSTPETTTIYKCWQCPYETKRKNDMPKHMLAHCTNVQMFECPHCPYKTKRKCDMPKHLLCHKPCDEVPLYKCDYCEYVTKRKGDLPKHILNHKDRSNLKLFGCSECDYKTKRKNDLHKHMLVHCDRHVAGVFKCLNCTYATDKVNKFSKHALSECTYSDDAINLEHMMLEDIIASVEDESIQIMGEDRELGHSEEAYSGYIREEEEEAEDGEPQDEHEQCNVSDNVPQEQYRAASSKRHGVFNINLGEFSIDVEGNVSENTITQAGRDVYVERSDIEQEGNSSE